jgi:hypothetical protein
MSGLLPLLQQLVERWRKEGIPILRGVNAATITDFESKYNVKLPCDMKEFFSTIDGMGDEYDEKGFFRFWLLEEVKPIEEHTPELVIAFPELAEYFFFFDHSIDLFMYAIRFGDSESSPTPIAQVYPQPNGLAFNQMFGSFAEFISIYVNDPDGLL